MRFASKPFQLDVFESGRRAGQELERALTALKLHQVRECLTAASLAIELVRTSDPEQTELVSRASKLLTEATELLREGVGGERDDRQSPPE